MAKRPLTESRRGLNRLYCNDALYTDRARGSEFKVLCCTVSACPSGAHAACNRVYFLKEARVCDYEGGPAPTKAGTLKMKSVLIEGEKNSKFLLLK